MKLVSHFLSKTAQLLALGALLSSSLPTQAQVLPAIGEQRTLVLMVNFQDAPDNKPWTAAQLQDLVFNQNDAFYRDASGDKVWFSGDVDSSWLTVSLDSSQCQSDTLAQQANALAQAQGYNLADYGLVLYFHPTNGCGWSGMGILDSAGRRVFLNGDTTLRVLSHEIGHTFGLLHAHALDCDQVTEGNCRSLEYGDVYDVMGSQLAYFNAFEEGLLGWQPNVAQANDGVYQLAPFHTGQGVEALKVPAGTDASGAQRWLYLEYRPALGYDAWMQSTTNVAQGLLVRSVVEGDPNSSQLLDMTPGSALFGDFNDAVLTVGQQFVDPQSGAVISLESLDDKGATVWVSAQAAQCTATAPALSLSPATSPSMQAGQGYGFQLMVTNGDATGCSNKTINLAAQWPTGWSGSLSSSSLTLAPGASSTVQLWVQSSSQALAGNYNVPVQASASGLQGATTATFVVGAANSAPVAVNDSASTQAGTGVSIPVLANDSDPDGNSLSISSVSGVNGSALIQGSSILFTPVSGFSGSTSFSYSISDGQGGSASATVTVSVAAANQAPLAVDDSASTSGSSVTIAVLANDSDPDGDKLTVSAVTQGSKGSVLVNSDGTLTYIPGRRFKGSDSFSYSISDGKGGSASATVSIGSSSSGGSTGGGGSKGHK
ncbi:Ig-like domain-containing protein [Gallaecimonas kandeliae]|uniref:Ig-like domain-containing protein n=1 Tax=Gallaecimonas kandeliae TaxID=3029055 RepID=UPI002647E935|nr:Ig-like domain-containing protein [Gallaecimonas kandeliae]WKE65659.1 Ig-like domain-containing protein [Gallaecimonas kandeliae]